MRLAPPPARPGPSLRCILARMDDATDSPVPNDEELTRARALYFQALVQLKVDAEYIQRYRDRVSRTIMVIAILRAIVSVGALSSWFSCIGQAKVWGALIVLSQVAEAVFAVLPLPARARALRTFVAALDAALIDALFEWEEEVQSPSANAKDVRRRWHRLLRRRHEAESTSLGAVTLPEKPRLFRLAQEAAATYFVRHLGATRQ